jgi:hypothetical protein
VCFHRQKQERVIFFLPHPTNHFFKPAKPPTHRPTIEALRRRTVQWGPNKPPK